MTNAIILHGKPTKEEYYDPNFPACSNYYWLPWLQKQLIIRGIMTQTPEMPYGWNTDYLVCKKEFERYEIKPETILIGHSFGGGFIVRWLSERKDVKVGKVILVAPWLDPRNEVSAGFFRFAIEPKLIERTQGVTIINSDDDYPGIHASVKILRDTIPGISYKELQQRKHFYDKNSMKLPEILEDLGL